MPNIYYLLRICLISSLSAVCAAAYAANDSFLSADQAFRFSSEIKSSENVRLNWKIADGYHLYRDRFKFSLAENSAPLVELLPVELPKGVELQGSLGAREAYYHQLSIDLHFRKFGNDSGPVYLKLRFQGCADQGLCYPPIEKNLTLRLSEATGPAVSPPATVSSAVQQSEQDRIAATLQGGSPGWVILSFFGFGLLMAFTPCIFPMIPILSGIIVGQGADINTSRALLLSASYVLAAALTYTVFGVLAGLFGGNLQALFQTPWIIISFSGLFVLLALSMFGFYELQIPSCIQQRITALSGRQHGGTLFSAAAMGALSALIVGPCMAAPLAGALIYIGQSGDALLGGLALFTMGLGMGAPLMLVGASAGALLPRAGAWMVAIKSVFGLVMLGVAIWMLQRVISASFALLLWGTLALIAAVFLGGLDETQQGSGAWNRLSKGMGIITLVYGVALLTGAAAGNDDPLHPLKGFAVTENRQYETAAILFRKLNTPVALDAELEAARQSGQPILLDFYADWCVSCREMEHNTFANARVQAELTAYRLLQADVTANDDNAKALLTRYALSGPPATLFFDRNGVEHKENRLVGYMGPKNFLTHLGGSSR
ncbi:protein-disulfide reductase DsbD [Candidatus Methylospira mobilis]|uniref:Thiol:disulfide interchange protein DsbD n=1 Tax=Candidatus Methylospira mobilis TaxID=1808979 RepID=A0A5Q0BNN7_9GAMM|nr:protein-disulfide reductase DsbD [Candidatus Methylospira mobilis]QFY43718.1 protein-disulfide reductase DsbD [Candidatus Methylospira mobilis]